MHRNDRWHKLGFKYAPAFGKGVTRGGPQTEVDLLAAEDYSHIEDLEHDQKKIAIVVISRSDYNMIMRALHLVKAANVRL